MLLDKISLVNFRNYGKFETETNAEIVLITGPNASGKTNLLESVYYLSRLKSFRTSDNLLVKAQEDYFKIAGKFGGSDLEALVQLNPKFTRQYKIDGQKTPRYNFKSFANVLFIPQDLNLFELGPSLRRKFLDQTLSQTSKIYSLDLQSLEHVLKHRAALFQMILEKQAGLSDLEVWNQELAQVSLDIFLQRQKFVDFLKREVTELYLGLTGFDSKIGLEYKSIDAESEVAFLEKLKIYESAEIKSGLNLYGPHRDDFILTKDGQLNTDNSSRGELRSQILALKLLQAKYLSKQKLGVVVLLDDVFSELDEMRRSKLIEGLKGHQIFITTTEEHHLPTFTNNIKTIDLSRQIF